MMKRTAAPIMMILLVLTLGCITVPTGGLNGTNGIHFITPETEVNQEYPHIAGYVSDGLDLLNAEKAEYDIIYTSSMTTETAAALRQRNPRTIILYQSPANYLPDSAIAVIEATTGQDITDSFWLRQSNGSRCAYGWTPELWAIDIREPANIEIIAEFFSKVLEYQPHYDGLFFDVFEESSRCDTVSDAQWVEKSAELLSAIRDEVGDEIIVTNAGYNYDSKSPYLGYLNGYAMESFLSGGAGFDEGLGAAQLVLQKTLEPHILIFTVYSENTITKQPIDKDDLMMALSLSLMYNHTYLHYAESLENVGVILWEDEFSVVFGKPLGPQYQRDNAYWREFENGFVIFSPYSGLTATFDESVTDIETDIESDSFAIDRGEGRIFLKS